jgi:hypothetical protein
MGSWIDWRAEVGPEPCGARVGLRPGFLGAGVAGGVSPPVREAPQGFSPWGKFSSATVYREVVCLPEAGGEKS